jgi:hypothetical protein
MIRAGGQFRTRKAALSAILNFLPKQGHCKSNDFAKARIFRSKDFPEQGVRRLRQPARVRVTRRTPDRNPITKKRVWEKYFKKQIFVLRRQPGAVRWASIGAERCRARDLCSTTRLRPYTSQSRRAVPRRGPVRESDAGFELEFAAQVLERVDAGARSAAVNWMSVRPGSRTREGGEKDRIGRIATPDDVESALAVFAVFFRKTGIGFFARSSGAPRATPICR